MDALKVCFVGTYPPTRCGLATFTQSLLDAMTPPGTPRTAGVVRVLDDPEPPRGKEVVAEWIASDPASRDRALAVMRGYDVAILQHEYGIYPGADGEDVVGFLRACPIPAVVVLHTVLVEPTAHQRKVLDQVMELADVLVVPTHAARARLLGVHEDFLPERVVVIPHGAISNVGPAVEPAAEPKILTWGLIGPGKGLEYGIGAMKYLQDLDPAPVYTIAGGTHPKVRAREGERYRDELKKQAADLGVSDSVVFEDGYLDPRPCGLARAADVILLPYESREQICSGVLVEAISSGTPVVATAFPHAVELLSSACGIVAPHAEPEAMARAIRRLLTDDSLASSMQGQARREAARHTWSSVGRQYTALIHRALAERAAA